jgi:hypothetical protein
MRTHTVTSITQSYLAARVTFGRRPPFPAAGFLEVAGARSSIGR